MGAEIVRRALPYSLKLIARNAGTNGSVVVQKVRGSTPSSILSASGACMACCLAG